MAVMSIITMFPLQYDVSQFWKAKQQSTNDAIVFVISIVVVVAVLVIVNIFKKKSPALSGGLSSGRQDTSGQKTFSGFALLRLAKSIGLDREQTKMLDHVFKNDMVSDPEKSLKNTVLLDRHFKRTYRAIERGAGSDDEAQDRLAVLFSTRNMLENSNVGGLTSSRQLHERTSAVLNFGREKHQTMVLASKGDGLVVECPENSSGPLDIPRGSKLNVTVFTKNNKGFSFESRIAGYSTSQGLHTMVLAHSNQLKFLSQRRFRRRQTVIASLFFFVYVEGTGKKQRLVVDKRSNPGNIMDISVGGCSIKTTVTVSGGARLKIEYKRGDATVAALGQVLRTNRTGMNTIMHVKFLKISRKSMNMINAHVYEYDYD